MMSQDKAVAAEKGKGPGKGKGKREKTPPTLIVVSADGKREQFIGATIVRVGGKFVTPLNNKLVPVQKAYVVFSD